MGDLCPAVGGCECLAQFNFGEVRIGTLPQPGSGDEVGGPSSPVDVFDPVGGQLVGVRRLHLVVGWRRREVVGAPQHGLARVVESGDVWHGDDEVLEAVAALGGVGERGGQVGPPGAGFEVGCGLVAELVNQRFFPGGEGGAVGRGEVAGESPPQRGGRLFCRQGPVGDGCGEVFGDGDVGVVEGGEAVSEHGGVGVAGEVGVDVAQEVGPDGDGVGGSEPVGEVLLPVVRGGAELGGSGGAAVAGFDLPGCPPHLDIGHGRRCEGLDR